MQVRTGETDDPRVDLAAAPTLDTAARSTHAKRRRAADRRRKAEAALTRVIGRNTYCAVEKLDKIELLSPLGHSTVYCKRVESHGSLAVRICEAVLHSDPTEFSITKWMTSMGSSMRFETFPALTGINDDRANVFQEALRKFGHSSRKSLASWLRIYKSHLSDDTWQQRWFEACGGKYTLNDLCDYLEAMFEEYPLFWQRTSVAAFAKQPHSEDVTLTVRNCSYDCRTKQVFNRIPVCQHLFGEDSLSHEAIIDETRDAILDAMQPMPVEIAQLIASFHDCGLRELISFLEEKFEIKDSQLAFKRSDDCDSDTSETSDNQQFEDIDTGDVILLREGRYYRHT